MKKLFDMIPIRIVKKNTINKEKKKVVQVNTDKEKAVQANSKKKKKINLFVKTPALTIERICALSGIKIPEKYERHRKILLSSNKAKELIYIKQKDPDYRRKLKNELRRFVEKYYTQEVLEKNEEELFGYIVDWLYHYGPRGFTLNDYFDYELYNKTEEETDKFLNGGYRDMVNKLCNKKEDRVLLKNKSDFNTTYAKYVKREWLDTTTCTFEQFKQFIKKFPVHFGKPVTGTGGTGAGILELDINKDIEKLFEEYRKKGLIIEQIVKQHKDLKQYNESSLNTIRVYTLLCADGEARALLAIIRFGRKGNTVDNFHAGGITAVIDVNTGIVETEALNRAHIRCNTHPDSGLPIKGFKIPCWGKIVEATTDAAKLTPTLRHIGWDVAVKEDGNIELIEGNSWPNFDVTQAPDQVGRKHHYEKYINELKQLKEKNNK